MIDTRAKVIPEAAILYVRQSDARDDERKGGIDYHVKLLKDLAKDLGWGVLRVIIENDVPDGKGGTTRRKSASAFKRRKVTLPDGTTAMRVIRPGFQLVLQLMRSGRCDGMLVVELDRVLRDPRDTVDLIDEVQARKLNVASYAGTLQFTNGGTDEEIDHADSLAKYAHRESRVKARRQTRARERNADKAMGHGGNRPFGWADDYKTAIWEEKTVVEGASRRYIQGISLRAIAAELREAGVPSVTGKPWSAETLKTMLVRPRNAGLVIYQGEIVDGAVGEWDALINPELFKAVRSKSARPSNSGRAPRWQGTGVYLCGKCADGTSVHVAIGGRSPRYRCNDYNHLTRNVAGVDGVVNEGVIDRFSQKDALYLFVPARPDIDAAGLRAERKAIKNNLATMAIEAVKDARRKPEYRAVCEWADERVAEIDKMLDDSILDSSLLDELINSDDVRATWENTPLATRQAVIRAVAIVTIEPITRHTNGFDPASVTITPRQWTAEEQLAA